MNNSVTWMRVLVVLLGVLSVGTILLIGCIEAISGPSPIQKDRSMCAIEGIQLLYYNGRYEKISDANGTLQVKEKRYLGTIMTCYEREPEEYHSSCLIGFKDSKFEPVGHCIGVYVSNNSCFLKEQTNCY